MSRASSSRTAIQQSTPLSLRLRGLSPPDIPVSDNEKPRNDAPFSYGGSLDKYEHFDNTPSIGREFTSGLQLTDLLRSEDSDSLIRDLAVLVSRRGVVFFREQDITSPDLTSLGLRMGELSGKPSASGLHVHPLTEDTPELPGRGVVAEISSEKQAKGGGLRGVHDDKSLWASGAWHSDITFEPIPSNYAALKIHTLPPTGGDTLWASAYEAYDRLSAPMAAFLETLTATHDANMFHAEAARLGYPIKVEGRGHPLNAGSDLRASHPVIRTNPVTGWKGIFVNSAFTKRIDNVTRDESDFLIRYCTDLVTHNHDLQVRFKWTRDTVAIWDNRSTLHCATYDYEAKRAGDRVACLGEAPFFDPGSKSRKEALREEGREW